MQTFIIAALSADGYIARDEKHAALWTSKEDKRRFIELTKRAGVVVMGSTTYATLPRPLKERVNVVYSRSKTYEGAETTQKTPHELLAELRERGFKEVAICGGSYIYTLFMEAKVVDKLYLTIEPIIFGSGVRLFNKDLTNHLKLVACGQTESGTLLLEYDVNHSGNV
jgi:dihydrofolate reductase